MKNNLYLCSVKDSPVIRASSAIIQSNSDFARHYSAGAQGVCARIRVGENGFWEDDDGLEDKATHLFSECNSAIHARDIASVGCINSISGTPTVMGDSVYVNLNECQDRKRYLANGSAELYDDGVALLPLRPSWLGIVDY